MSDGLDVRERAAKALYTRWQGTDAELRTSWEDAGTRLQGVFYRQVDVVLLEVSRSLENVVSDLDVYESEHPVGKARQSGWYWLETELYRKGLMVWQDIS